MKPEPIRLVLIDDHPIVREGIRALRSEYADILIIGEASSPSEGLALLEEVDPDVVVLDISSHEGIELDVIRAIKSRRPAVKILVFSTRDDPQLGVQCLRHGADGFLGKREPTSHLIEAVRKVARGGKFLNAPTAEALAAAVGDPRMTPLRQQLSAREFDVFIRIASGQSLTTIGQDLGLSVKTVGTYRSRILEKTGSTSNADLTRLAVANKLLE